ncbi:uncharacterized protein PAC_04696 [Phialocephala subalpina]|uniref:Uncharacterized protein n=1 Tax=Phialocephala subalpina TaxID=576137 RepID=A0A1L7WPW7_9HELO|nr:uncharacterized protein PAC_04696 [Phialocephala subalpina]
MANSQSDTSSISSDDIHDKEPYKKIQMCLTSWIEDDMGVKEMVELEEAWRRFNVVSDIYTIADGLMDGRCIDPEEKLQSYADSLDKESLFILFYTGHGALDKNDQLMLRFYAEKKHGVEIPGIQWSTIQMKLNSFKSDVLILLDACHSGSACNSAAFANKAQHRMEVIAACASDRIALGPRWSTYPRLLTGILHDLADEGEASTVQDLQCHLGVRHDDAWNAIRWCRGHEGDRPSQTIYTRLRGDPKLPSISIPGPVHRHVYVPSRYIDEEGGDYSEDRASECGRDIGQQEIENNMTENEKQKAREARNIALLELKFQVRRAREEYNES